jgi:hypothetical protein
MPREETGGSLIGIPDCRTNVSEYPHGLLRNLPEVSCGWSCMEKSLKSSYEGPWGGFGTPTDYAFAMIILENN